MNTLTEIVWRRSRLKGTQRLILLALALFIDGQGVSRVSITGLETLTGLSRRTIFNALAPMKQSGELSFRSGKGSIDHNEYHINLQNLLAQPDQIGAFRAFGNGAKSAPLNGAESAHSDTGLRKEKNKRDIAPLRGATATTFSHESESEVPPQNHQVGTPGRDTHIESGKPKSEEKIKSAPTTYKPASASKRVKVQLGPWVKALCDLYPNRGRCDISTVERIAHRYESDGPRILAAAVEVSKTPEWKGERVKFLTYLSKFVEGGTWRTVPVVLTVEDARREFESIMKGDSQYLAQRASGLRRRFDELTDGQDLTGHLAIIHEAREISKMRASL